MIFVHSKMSRQMSIPGDQQLGLEKKMMKTLFLKIDIGLCKEARESLENCTKGALEAALGRFARWGKIELWSRRIKLFMPGNQSFNHSLYVSLTHAPLVFAPAV